jgi:hypothetical protein
MRAPAANHQCLVAWQDLLTDHEHWHRLESTHERMLSRMSRTLAFHTTSIIVLCGSIREAEAVAGGALLHDSAPLPTVPTIPAFCCRPRPVLIANLFTTIG